MIATASTTIFIPIFQQKFQNSADLDEILSRAAPGRVALLSAALHGCAAFFCTHQSRGGILSHLALVFTGGAGVLWRDRLAAHRRA